MTNQELGYVIAGAFSLSLLIVFLVALATNKNKGVYKMARNEIIESYLMKIITLLQNIASNQSKEFDKLRDIDNHIFQQVELLKQIQKQTRSESAEEQEEIKRKLDELNRLVGK